MVSQHGSSRTDPLGSGVRGLAAPRGLKQCLVPEGDGADDLVKERVGGGGGRAVLLLGPTALQQELLGTVPSLPLQAAPGGEPLSQNKRVWGPEVWLPVSTLTSLGGKPADGVISSAGWPALSAEYFWSTHEPCFSFGGAPALGRDTPR